MSFLTRAAWPAAALVCAILSIATSAPGLAQQLTSTALANAPVAEPVPADPATDLPAVPPATNVEPAPPVSSPGFGTLAAAVAAQTTDTDTRELECLAAGVYFEANGEPLAGQLAVAQVILARTQSGRFPRSVCSVLGQPGQFSFVRGGVVPSAAGRPGWKVAVAVAKVAQRDLWDAVAPRALYFHARSAAPSWRAIRVAAIGNHIFYR